MVAGSNPVALVILCERQRAVITVPAGFESYETNEVSLGPVRIS
ncbi:hypothetical protein [Haloferax larsenii]|nr:hypothetical protein [Haloferax larsenii]